MSGIQSINKDLYKLAASDPAEIQDADRKRLDQYCLRAKLGAVAAIAAAILVVAIPIFGLLLAVGSCLIAYELYRMAINVERRLSGDESPIVSEMVRNSLNPVRTLVGRGTILAKYILPSGSGNSSVSESSQESGATQNAPVSE